MITIKKTFTILISSLFLLVGCQEENDRVVVLKSDISEGEVKGEHSGHVQKEESKNFYSLKENHINNLDDLIQNSDTIIMGKVLDVNPFGNTGTYKYSVSVDKALIGPASSSTIDVYVMDNVLEKGKQYALFLNYWESELYPNPVYNLIDESIIIEIQQKKQKLIDAKNIVEGKTLNELINYIKSSNVLSHSTTNSTSVVNSVINSVDSLNELVDMSTNIIHIIPDEIVLENPYVRSFNATIIDVLKGTIKGEQISLNLPSTVEVGKEYIIILKEGPGKEHLLLTREGSVVSKEDEKTWQAILEQVGK